VTCAYIFFAASLVYIDITWGAAFAFYNTGCLICVVRTGRGLEALVVILVLILKAGSALIGLVLAFLDIVYVSEATFF